MVKKNYLVMCKGSILVTVFLLVVLFIMSNKVQAAVDSYVKRNGAVLYEDINGNNIQDSNEPQFRWVSFNINDYTYKEFASGKFVATEWELDQQFKGFEVLGAKVIRPYTITVGDDKGVYTPMVTAPGVYNEESLRGLDKFIQIAGQHNIRVYIPLVNFKNNWTYGGTSVWAGWRGKDWGEFYTDNQVKQDFKNFISYLLNRTNYYTGVKYKDDKTILGWETGNELEADSSILGSIYFTNWTKEIAAHIKSIDSNHLVIDGKYGVNRSVLDDPNVDIVSDHWYRTDTITNKGEGKKPFIIGEMGWSADGRDHLEGEANTNWLRDKINEALNAGVTGINVWNYKQSTKGAGMGFYNGNDSLTFSWPGNPASRYDEVGTLLMIRAKAHEINGEVLPPIPVPEAPVLPEIDTVHSIAWIQGFGADTYTIERAESPNGPWTIIATDLRNDVTPYEPYNDYTAVTGTSYYYRIIAENSAGYSEYSNVRGPVVTDNEITVTKEWSFYHPVTYGTNAGWTSDSGTILFGADLGGMLRFGVTNSNPSILSPDSLDINIEHSKKIRITMRNGTASDTGRIMFTTTTDNTWNDAKSKNFTINADDDLFTTYTIDMSDVQGWNGTLERLKIMPEIGVSSGDIGIQSIKIIQTEHLQEVTMIDELNDWSKTYSHSANLNFDVSCSNACDGDTSCVSRTDNNAGEIIWHQNDIKQFLVTGYFWPYEGINHFTFYTSSDGQNWTLVSPEINGGSGDWVKYIYSLKSLTNVNYVKLCFNSVSGGQIWNPHVGKAEITYSSPGTGFIVDDLNDFGKACSRTPNLSFDSTNVEVFDWDDSRVSRNDFYIPIEEMVWYQKNITSFEAEGYHWPYEGLKHFVFYVSEDGDNWQMVTPDITYTRVDWQKYTYELPALTNVNYVKIRWVYNWPEGHFWNQQLGRIKLTYLIQ